MRHLVKLNPEHKTTGQMITEHLERINQRINHLIQETERALYQTKTDSGN